MHKTLLLVVAAALMSAACSDDPPEHATTGSSYDTGTDTTNETTAENDTTNETTAENDTTNGGENTRTEDDNANTNDDEPVSNPGEGEIVPTVGLYAFDECTELLDHLRTTAERQVGPRGLYNWSEEQSQNRPGTTEPLHFFGQDPVLTEGVDFSGTNAAQRRMDEADMVKTDGSRILLISDGELVVVDVASRQVTGSVEVAESWSPELFISGDSVVMVAHSYTDSPETVIQRIDVVDGNPTVAETLRVTGNYLSARSVGGGARVIIQSDPNWHLPFFYLSTTDSETDVTEANRDVVRSSTLKDWLPTFTHTHASGATEDGLLPDCDNFHVPAEFSDFRTTTVLSIPMNAEMDTATATSVLGATDIVYASPESLYVATSAWVDLETLDDQSDMEQYWADLQTNIHRFDITNPDGAVYTASGQVPGAVLDRFWLSEHDGHLRVVTTDMGDVTSPSQVRVLREIDGQLVEIGSVGYISKGDRVESVRFVGDVGYVATFNHVNPFYTIDLADPANPAVLGELKAPRSSSYLHPIGDGVVLGVGPDIKADGSADYAKVSLFDVTDLTGPREVAVWTSPGSYHVIDWNHRAFLWWAPKNLAVVPFKTLIDWYSDEADWDANWSGVVVLEIDGDQIRERGRIAHKLENCPDPRTVPYEAYEELREEGCDPNSLYQYEHIIRGIVIGDELWTLSYPFLMGGSEHPGWLEVYDLDTLEPLASLRL